MRTGGPPAPALPAVPSVRGQGPRPVPVLGWNVEAVSWSLDPVGYLTRLQRTYGPLSLWRGERTVRAFAFAPEHNQKVLGNPELFHIVPQKRRKVVPEESAVMNLRSGLLSLDGEEHRRHRKLMSPALHHKHVEGFSRMISEMTRRALESWAVGEVRDLEADMRRLVHRIAMKAVLGMEDERELSALDGLVEGMLAAIPRAMLFPFDLPGSSYRRMLKTADGIQAFLRTLVEKKGAAGGVCGDVLKMMMDARQENGEGFVGGELIAEAYNVLCHESSASALVWTLFLLAQHPRVYAELLDELSGELDGGDPEPEQLSRLPLLERVIKESMRLLPPASFGTRFAAEACSLGECELPKGVAVTVSQYVTHRLPEIYREPRRFRPERWEGFKPGPYEYFPFGAGVHNCIGGAFAMLEMKLVLCAVLQSFCLKVMPKSRVNRVFRLSLRPKRGLPVLVLARGSRLSASHVRGNIREMVDMT
jgi:cytochrome P450